MKSSPNTLPQTPWIRRSLEKRIDPSQLENIVKALRGQGKTIATLNGSFDLMHAGHLHILYEASLAGDVLIVALNTDRSIQQYKSPSRPIIPLEYRLQMISALECVDYVTWFDEVDPREILSKIKPDVHINGAEYGENCIEAEVVKRYGGKIHLVKRLTDAGLATTEILKKIKSLCD